jgi:Leucine-rich repeat (LRR) protein
VADLSPLKGLALKDLACDFCPDRDTEILRPIKTLETINGKPAAEFWKQVDARKAALEAWLKRVADLPAEKQVVEFEAKMKELNPGFDGDVKHETEGKVVTEIRFVTDRVTDVAPLRVFDSLRVLDCPGTHTNWQPNGRLADLTPLKGMNLTGLTKLNLIFTQVGDAGLAHFSGCKNLTVLNLGGTKASDAGLAHFSGCKNLRHLNLGGTKVSDAGLAHFSDCKDLRSLQLNTTKVGDAGLAHFSGCKNLTFIHLDFTQVSDAGLAHFSGCKNLTHLFLNSTTVSDEGLALFKDCKNLMLLWLDGTQVSDTGLAHFKDCKNLTHLGSSNTQVTDLSPLKGMPLKDLTCDFCPDRDTEILRPIKTLETINGKPAAEFWEAVDARKAALEAWLKRVSRLPPEKQVEEFRAKMQELNPGFDGQVRHETDGEVVTEIRFVTDKVTDVAPLRVFVALKVLDCEGTHTDWRSNGQLADLTPLKGMNLTGLTWLNLNRTKVVDAGLAHFEDCKNLTNLGLLCTQVGDAGLAHFKGCKNLTQLNLHGTQVSDAGLAYFKDGKNLTHLWLGDTKVGDVGMAHFAGCKNLTVLGLERTKVGDAGLAHFSGCKNLTGLNLHGTQVSDAGLAHFRDCKSLAGLSLLNTQVTDLSPLKGMPLKELSCDFCPDRDTEILRAIKSLETINDRPAAEFWKQVDARKADLEVWLKRVARLPAEKQVEEFKAKMKELNPGFDGDVKHENDGKVVTGIRFVTDKVTDVAPLRVFGALRVLDCAGTHTPDWMRGNGQLADLTPLKGMNLTGLTDVNLSFTKVGDAGLAHFSGCKNLTVLGLWGTRVGDAGLVHFSGCKNLMHLNLGYTKVSDAGLAHFENCKNLTWLELGGTQVGDAGLAHFKDCKNLTKVGLQETQVSDKGLDHFSDCKHLTRLDLKQTKVTKAKIEELHKALPKCKIEWDGGVIEPKARE